MKKKEKMNKKTPYKIKGREYEAFDYSKGFMLSLLFCALSVIAYAQEFTSTKDSLVSPRTTTTSYQIGVGPNKILDTYLSAAHFRGTGFTFLATKEYDRENTKWSTLMEHQAHISSTHDKADKADEIEGSYNFYCGRYYRWSLFTNRLQIHAGAMINANLGFIYNTVNGNNPAQARISLNIMPSAIAQYRFKMLHRLASVRYEVQLPLVGIMFSPNYGQSYYEIFSQGDYDHNIVPTTFVCTPTFRQQLSLDLNINKRFTIRIGYLGDYQQASVNNLKSHIYAHRIMIGVVKRFKLISYRP